MKFKVNYTLVLVASILVIMLISVGSRIATSMFFLKGFHLTDTNYRITPASQTVNGITFTIGYIPKGSPYYDSLLNAEFNTFLVTITNNGTEYLDYDPLNFFLEVKPDQIDRALDVDEIQDAVSNGFLGAAKPIQTAKKLVAMTSLPGARLFPGYNRTGLVLFPRFANSPEQFVIKLAHMTLRSQPFADIRFILKRPGKTSPPEGIAPSAGPIPKGSG